MYLFLRQRGSSTDLYFDTRNTANLFPTYLLDCSPVY